MGIINRGIMNFFHFDLASFKGFLAGLFGSIVSVIVFYAIIYPVKYLSPIWQWPPLYIHLLMIISCGLIGWVLYKWKDVQ